MNKKKFLIAFIVVFLLLELTNYLVYQVILSSSLMSDAYKTMFNSPAVMGHRMWIMYVTDLIWSFFFVFFFVKGHENKGILEGLRFGVYIGIFYTLVSTYQSYVIYPYSYSLILEMFITGFIQCVIFGVVTALIYKPKILVIPVP